MNMVLKTRLLNAGCFTAIILLLSSPASANWQKANGPLSSVWTDSVTADNAHQQYPRPQMVRKDFQSLNGLWEYAIRPTASLKPENFDGQILVPFPPESALSGVAKPVNKPNRLWYKRKFTVNEKWKNKRILIHFDAVDWDATVWLNEKLIGTHSGGYDPFTFDITDYLNNNAEQEIVVSVWDPSQEGSQPCGKQFTTPEKQSCRYTSTTGIWQSVWLEPVSQTYIKNIKLTPDIDNQQLKVEVIYSNDVLGYKIQAQAKQLRSIKDKQTVLAGQKIFLKINEPKLWSPDAPFLYDLELTLHDENGKIVDEVKSYFGMRKISLGKDNAGLTRILLNNKEIFLCGPLDQGYWSDGIYTAPCDQALIYDIETIKKLGFNTARKHVKVEMQRWYYHCDKLGLLVWQDMPSNQKAFENKPQFEKELNLMIDNLYNHPSVIIWSVFNEGWGEFDSEKLAAMVKQKDPTRLVDQVSGGFDNKAGDIKDIHSYPLAGCPKPQANRAVGMGETGGMGLIVKDHMWQKDLNWGYGNVTTPDQLTEEYIKLLRATHILKGTGLCTAIYTQLSDIETEINGLVTYDRKIFKVNPEKFAVAAKKLQQTPPRICTIAPSSRKQAILWSYTTTTPDIKWNKPDFDFSSWKKAPGGFGTETPGSVVRTSWTSDDIWLRRNFELDNLNFNEPYLYINQNDNAEVYINSIMVDRLPYSTEDYVLVPLSKNIIESLKIGENYIAIHCKQTKKDGQYIDAGIIDAIN